MRKPKLLRRRHSSCFALGTVQTDTVCNNTGASSGSPTDATVEMDPTGSCSALGSTQAPLGALTLPGAGDASSVQWRQEEPALVAAFQKPQYAEMILKISLSRFATVILASNTESATSEHVSLFSATGCMSNRSSALTGERNQPDYTEIQYLGCPYSPFQQKYLYEVQHPNQFF